MDELISSKEASRLANLEVSWIRRLIMRGTLPAIKFAGVWMIKKGDLLKYLKTRKESK